MNPHLSSLNTSCSLPPLLLRPWRTLLPPLPLLPIAQAALQKELGLPVDPNAPLFGFIGRLVRRGKEGRKEGGGVFLSSDRK